MNAGFPSRSYDTNGTSFSAAAMPPIGTTATSFAHNPNGGPPSSSAQSRKFYDDINPVPLTWNRMVEDMRRAIERYRQAINNSARSEFVKRAEDISDHLRLLLAAGSGTTDNHSGNPSIISTNKALYPHFRETMSRFSKLVLSSHIAASDFPPPDSYSKCLKEADGVLNGVYGFVEVARQQRGEDIPRLVPGFVVGSTVGGSWHHNGADARDANSSMSFIDQEDYEPFVEPTVKLDFRVLERLEDQMSCYSSGSCREYIK
jgi:son of sevenless-like protein